MKAGKSMKAAARSWRGGKSKPRKRAAPKTKRRSVRSRVKTGGRKVARRGGFNTQKIYKILRMAALALPAGVRVTQGFAPDVTIKNILMDYTGYNSWSGKMEFDKLMAGWGPYLGAVVTTYGIPKLIGLLRGL